MFGFPFEKVVKLRCVGAPGKVDDGAAAANGGLPCGPGLGAGQAQHRTGGGGGGRRPARGTPQVPRVRAQPQDLRAGGHGGGARDSAIRREGRPGAPSPRLTSLNKQINNYIGGSKEERRRH
eukprot:1194423-Prorocentrum_minimum.AAC.24